MLGETTAILPYPRRSAVKFPSFSAAILASLAFLTGCGLNHSNNTSGSGNNGSGTLSSGVFQGAIATGSGSNGAIILVTPDGQFWSVSSQTTSALTPLQGFTSSQLAASGLNYSGPASVFSSPGTSSTSGTVTINSASSSNLSGTISQGSTNDSFSSNALTGFNFNTGATIATLSANSWKATFLDNDTATLTVDSSGNISGASTAGCAISGSVTPDKSGSNFFDLTLTFGAAPCSLPSTTVTGFAVNAGTGSSAVFVGAGSNSGNTMGSAFIATAGTA
ncbi:hypothetical protein Acid345_2734 [Candidatus Koribacter versatilis Ellin345]|uniref:Uncharacterized protein n=1 Tax=Koribacter versatilis (strain Ellin345) TaxID=204669 RepID=Q1IN15_KORVE|nr:hypothetical protein Acid345_2734 [Candidatus Koribacter versatilis Ellin345]